MGKLDLNIPSLLDWIQQHDVSQVYDYQRKLIHYLENSMNDFDEIMQKMARIPDGIVVMVDSHHGVYAPQVFLESLAATISEVNQRDIDTVLKGPDDVENDWYWEAWETIENNAVITSTKGEKYMIYQDGDIFLLKVAAYEQAIKELEDEEETLVQRTESNPVREE